MKKQILLITLLMASSSSVLAQTTRGGGFAPPNAYGNPGSYYGGPGYGHNFGYNTMPPGYVPPGQYYANPYGGVGTIPVYGVPTPIGGGLYNLNSGGTVYQVWRSPSGYYYPWIGGGGYYGGPVMYGQTANQAPTQQTPPVSTVIGDMLTYLDQQKEKGRIDAPAYEHLHRRAADLQSKYANLRTAGEGSIDPQDEKQIRTDLDSLGAEVVRAVH